MIGIKITIKIAIKNMNGKTIVYLSAVVLVAAGGMWGFRAATRQVERGEEQLSGLAQDLLAARGSEWVHMPSKHFVIHALNSSALVATAKEADFAYEEVGRRLGQQPTGGKTHLFFVDDAPLWKNTIVASGLRPEGLSLRYQDEIFILGAPVGGAEKVNLPHEVVHLRLHELYAERLPLWLEEGMASYLGWEVAQAYHLEQGTKLTRTTDPLPPDEFLPASDVLGAEVYPEDPAAVRAFYRQTEERARAIVKTIGRSSIREFLSEQVEHDEPWQQTLRDRFHCTNEDLEAIEKTVRERCLNGTAGQDER